MMVQYTEVYHQMKPRIQKLVLDWVFTQYSHVFEFQFEGCDKEFQRELYQSAEYEFFNCEYDESTMGEFRPKIWPDKEEKPSILDANRYS